MKKALSFTLPAAALLSSSLATAQPAVTVSPEPSVGSSVTYLPMAPASANSGGNGQLSLFLRMSNNQSTSIHLNQVVVDFPGTQVASKTIPANLGISSGATGGWSFDQPDNILLPASAPGTVRLRLYFDAYTTPVTVTYPLAAYRASTPTGSNRFWARVGDLRPGEYWVGNGAVHAASVLGSQLFAYDVGVEAWDSALGRWNELLPGTDGTHNSDYRIWGKPLRAVASGTVVALRNDFPTNQTPGTVDPSISKFWTSEGGDGNGNFFSIDNGSEVVLYAHMQPGSLNPLLTVGSTVHEGDFLGLAGNAGSSSKPHLHIHASKSSAGPAYWAAALRPLPLYGASAIDNSVLPAYLGNVGSAPWSALSGTGLPSTRVMIWPSSQTPVALAGVSVKDFALVSTGQLWVVETDGRVRTTNDRLDNTQPGVPGVFLDINPAGSAKAVALSDAVPYLIASDDRVWKGTSSAWIPVQSSGGARRLATDAVTGKVWIVALDNSVAAYDPATSSWSVPPGGGLGKDLCAYNGTAYLVGMDDRIYKNSGAGWSPIAGSFTARRIAVDASSGKLWAIGMNDGIWYSSADGTWTEYPGSGRAKELVLFKGVPYVIGLDDRVWKGVGLSGWVPANVVQPM